MLAAAFPEAKIVHVKRNPAAVCWANYKQYFSLRGFGYCYELDDIIRYYKLYANLMKFWEVKLPNKIYNLDYEVLTTNQDDETKKLIQHLGLDWEKNACHLKIIEGVLLQRLTCKLGIKFTKVVRSNGKNINHSLMEHLIILTIN